ncbi:hypothetical protein KXQ82_08730 [Mucilaginibacter sp. HMF5004]|uniref:hypothetical protein n=1 Tax=Mucilaginibacter rivuli TaxID=2857527 RepID=UPI001C5F3048|nr:hypothetical protein [Mucilaginibacter rivuli]MBW4889799.1 hypothetical protein [Mucilaginibacter rivuli]
MKNPIIKITVSLCCLVVFSCVSLPAHSQTIDSVKRSYWLGFGYGGATNKQSISGFINNINLNYQLRGNHLITLNAQGDLGEQAFYTPKHVTNISTFDILGGKIYSHNSSMFTLQAGLGLVHLHAYDRTNIPSDIIYNESNRFSVGIPVSAQAYLVGFKAIGIGVGAWANLNLLQPVAGVNFNYAFGRIITPGRIRNHHLNDSLRTPSSLWLSFGVGSNSITDAWGRFDMNVEIAHRWLLTGNVAGSIAEHIINVPTHVARHGTADLLFGRLYKKGQCLFSASAGLGLTHFNSYDTDGTGSYLNQHIQNTIGIPVLVQGYLVGFNTLGVGIGGYANFNTVRNEVGLSLSFAFGKMVTVKKY